MKRVMKKISALALSALLLITLLPETFVFAENPTTIADQSTLTSWEDAFGTAGSLSTRDVGRIWVDKSVSTEDVRLSGDIGNGASEVTISKEQDADFLVGLSALGSAASIRSEISVPTDTVFVLDMSPRMGKMGVTGTQEQNAVKMFRAANASIKELMEENENNRIAVVVYANDAQVLLPLDHYINTEADYITYDKDSEMASANGQIAADDIVDGEYQIKSDVSKNTQAGMFLGMSLLAKADTTLDVHGTKFTRSPQVILFSEGEAKLGDTDYTNPPVDGTSFNIGKWGDNDHNGDRDAQTFAALLTIAYMKEKVTAHYYTGHPKADERLHIYTIGVNIESANAPELAKILLNPKKELTEGTSQDAQDFRGYFSTWQTTGSVTVKTGGGTFDGGNPEKVTFNKEDDTIEIDTLAYNDKYYTVEGSNWDEVFENITQGILNSAPSAPTEVDEGAPGTGGESGKVVFTDQLGAYMKVTGMPSIVYAGVEYSADSTKVEGNQTFYYFSGMVDDNGVYPEANLADIRLVVSEDENGMQTLLWEVPASMLPLRTMNVEGIHDGTQMTYTIQQEKAAYPIRLFYSTKRETTFSVSANDYLTAFSENGKIDFYQGMWDAQDEQNQYGMTSAVFTPAAENSFYHYTEDTPLYVLKDDDGNFLMEEQAIAADVTLIEPGKNSAEIGGQTYTLAKADEYVKGRAYYYAHTYYEETDGTTPDPAAEMLVDYHILEDGSRIDMGADGNAEISEGVLHIKKGTNKLSRVSDTALQKENNVTGTAATARHPFYELTGEERVIVRLGNNGKVTADTPRGTLTISVGETTSTNDQPLPEGTDDVAFTYTLELLNNCTVQLLQDYQFTADTNLSFDTDGKVQFTLKKGESLTVDNLPVGTSYQLTETKVAGYTPTFSGAGGANGQILYREEGKDAYANAVVTHTYDNTKVLAALTYDGNAPANSSVDNVPDAQSALGGSTITLSKQTPALTFHDGSDKKAVFIGWSQTKNDQIYGVDEYASYLAWVKDHPVYQPSSSFVLQHSSVLYAVWGWDSDGDGKPDVIEMECRLTYDTNGGNADGPAAEVLWANVAHQLNTSTKPTHEADPLTKDAIIFIGWSNVRDSHIYDVNSTTNPSLIFEITAVSDVTVYAVWGYDRNNDGIPDVNEQGYTLTYDGNAQMNGIVEGVPADSNRYVAHQYVMLEQTAVPTHGDVNQTKVVFIGWSRTKSTQIYGSQDEEALAMANVVTSITFDAANETVYAVWGYDEDDDGKADVVKENYVITASAGDNGSIDPRGTVFVEEGDSQSFVIAPKQGYTLHTLVIDGKQYLNDKPLAVAGLTQTEDGYVYLFADVNQNHSISVTFASDANGNNIPDQYEEPEETLYTLTVENGSGSGTYTAEEKVELVASVIEGKTFVRWVSDNGGTFADDTADKTVFTMPAADVTVRAVYADVEDEEDQTDQTPTPTPKPGEDEGLPNGNDPSETKPQTTPSKEESAADDTHTAAGNEHLQSWWLGTLGAGAMAVLLLICKRSKKTDH